MGISAYILRLFFKGGKVQILRNKENRLAGF